MSYFKLPEKNKQFIITIGTVVIYGAIFAITDTLFPEIPGDIKRKITQGGLFVIFLSGLLASQSFLWHSKVQHNKELAEMEIEKSEENLKVLEAHAKSTPTDLAQPIKENNQKLMTAKSKLEEVNNHPYTLIFSGKLSVFLLGLGTLLSIVGAG